MWVSRSRWIAPLGVAAALAILSSTSARAASGCAAPLPVPDGNTVVKCRRVTIEIEKGGDLRLSDRDGNGLPDDTALKSGAIFIEDDSTAGRNPFQVRTPDAIASVRGTRWAVDVSGARTSIFVVAGSVGVRRRFDNQSVALTAGEGVDVLPEATPLVVKRWAAERVEALLGRFGR